MKVWIHHQDINERISKQIREGVEEWPIYERSIFPGHQRLYRYIMKCKPYFSWVYQSMATNTPWGIREPRPSIDEVLKKPYLRTYTHQPDSK
jgi:hypothetical protein